MRKNMKQILFILMLAISLIFTTACDNQTTDEIVKDSSNVSDVIVDGIAESMVEIVKNKIEDKSENKEAIAEGPVDDKTFEGYRVIDVDGGDTSGYREANVAVNIGFGDREYWAFTNEHGQLVRVVADEIVLQDDNNEPVNSDGRYYSRMADVAGVGADTGYDRGHVIADSLGGVANAYNITPQESTLNRHGDQAYMEKLIRDAGGCTDFQAIITYPDTKTQIPSKYKYTYTIKGHSVVDEFENINPDEFNAKMGLTGNNEGNVSSEQSTDSQINKYKGSINSDKYHLPNYTHSGQIADHNLVWFDSIEDAEAKGYEPCGICF